jgi:hypothetical protein
VTLISDQNTRGNERSGAGAPVRPAGTDVDIDKKVVACSGSVRGVPTHRGFRSARWLSSISRSCRASAALRMFVLGDQRVDPVLAPLRLQAGATGTWGIGRLLRANATLAECFQRGRVSASRCTGAGVG